MRSSSQDHPPKHKGSKDNICTSRVQGGAIKCKHVCASLVGVQLNYIILEVSGSRILKTIEGRPGSSTVLGVGYPVGQSGIQFRILAALDFGLESLIY